MLHQSTAYAYEPDTEVVDEPEPPPIAIGRVSTGDLVAQILVMSQWHRRTPDLLETACGVPVGTVMTTPIRREVLTLRDGGLCSDCFTEHERMKARRNDIEETRIAEEEDRKWLAEASERARQRNKRNTGER
jgi:hypothetical protein